MSEFAFLKVLMTCNQLTLLSKVRNFHFLVDMVNAYEWHHCHTQLEPYTAHSMNTPAAASRGKLYNNRCICTGRGSADLNFECIMTSGVCGLWKLLNAVWWFVGKMFGSAVWYCCRWLWFVAVWCGLGLWLENASAVVISNSLLHRRQSLSGRV